MGCTVSTGGASGHEVVAAGDTTIATAPSAGSGNVLSVFVRGAAGLRDADGGLAGGSDAYCVLRVGPKGSNFRAKSEDTERFSSTAIGYESPKWNFASRVAGVQPGDAALELHVIVMDRDAFDSDDFLGEVRVGLDVLAESEPEGARDYELKGENAAGTITLLTGCQVEEVMMQDLQVPTTVSGTELQSWFGAIGQHFSSQLETIRYYKTMVGFGISAATGGFRRGKWFTDQMGPDWVWAGPFPNNCQSFMRYKDVKAKLVELGDRLGTSNGTGDIFRENFLGFQMLNSLVWPELPESVRGIG